MGEDWVTLHDKTKRLYETHLQTLQGKERRVWDSAVRKCFRTQWYPDGEIFKAKVFAAGHLITEKGRRLPYDVFSNITVLPTEGPVMCRGESPNTALCLGSGMMGTLISRKIHHAHKEICSLLLSKLVKPSGLKGFRGKFNFVDIVGRSI